MHGIIYGIQAYQPTNILIQARNKAFIFLIPCLCIKKLINTYLNLLLAIKLPLKLRYTGAKLANYKEKLFIQTRLLVLLAKLMHGVFSTAEECIH